MRWSLRFPKWAVRSKPRNGKPRRSTLGLSSYHRRLVCKALETRTLLSAGLAGVQAAGAAHSKPWPACPSRHGKPSQRQSRQQAKLTASDGAAGDVSAGRFRSAANGGGRSTCRRRQRPGGGLRVHGVWLRLGGQTQTAKLTASDGAAGDISALGLDQRQHGGGRSPTTVGGNADQGAAYVFTEPGSGWANMTQTAKLTASDGAADDYFGGSVSISGNTVVVGADGATVGGNSDQGAAYVFTEPGSGWANMTQTAKLTASDGAAGDYFGCSVSISGNTVVVGADYATVGANATRGRPTCSRSPPPVGRT